MPPAEMADKLQAPCCSKNCEISSLFYLAWSNKPVLGVYELIGGREAVGGKVAGCLEEFG